jgi:hypothetical protein
MSTAKMTGTSRPVDAVIMPFSSSVPPAPGNIRYAGKNILATIFQRGISRRMTNTSI